MKRLICKLFRIQIHNPTDVVPLATRESWKLTLDQWRQQEQMVLESRKLAQNLTYKAQMDVLRNSHPCHTLFTPIGVSPTDRVVQQAKIEGYELCLNNLESMSKQLKSPKPLEATFSDPDENSKPLKRK